MSDQKPFINYDDDEDDPAGWDARSRYNAAVREATDTEPPAEDDRFVETLVYKDDGTPEIVQVEEPGGQHRMHFVGLDE